MDKNYIKNIIQKIVNKEFSDPIRRKIVVYQDRINLCAPCCGDSHKNKYAKRGNLYFNNLYYICFNCDKKTTFDKLCKDFNEQIDPDKKLEMIQHLDSFMTYSDYEGDFIDAKFDDLIDLGELERVFNSNLTPISNFEPIKVNGGVYKYLTGRGISPDLHKNIYQAKYWKNEDESEWIIVMLNRRADKVLGIQIRNLKSGKRRMFKIYNYENLLEWINIGKDVNYELDMNKIVVYNKLSYYFNILNVDMLKKITVFEGYLDSLFFPNSIGLVGVNTDSKFLEKNELEIQYFFDNDETGLIKTEEKLKNGFKVFLWKKLFNDLSNKKKTDDHKYLYRISKIKDINKLAELVTSPYNKLKLQDYFSEDILDLKWIPKFKKSKYNEEDKDYNYKFDSFNRL
jgi:hypothetical protein